MKFDKLKHQRKTANITQEELAEALGVNRATISKYENGQIEPSITQLQAIADTLGVHLLDLVGSSEEFDQYEVKITVPPNIECAFKDIKETYDLLSDVAKTEFWRLLYNNGTQQRIAPNPIVELPKKSLSDLNVTHIKKAPSVSDEAAELAAANDSRKSEETLGKLLESFCSKDEIQMLNDYKSLSKQGKEYMRQTMEMAKGTYKKDCESHYMGVG